MLLHTSVDWLPVDDALVDTSLTVAALDSHAVDQEPLLRLVAELARLVWP